MKEIQFVKREGHMVDALGIPPEIYEPVDTCVQQLVADGKTVIEIIEYVRDNFELNPTEWTCFMYNLGTYVITLAYMDEL